MPIFQNSNFTELYIKIFQQLWNTEIMVFIQSQVSMFSKQELMTAAKCGSMVGDILSWSISNWTIEARFPRLVTIQALNSA
jgi:hypothetical protein